MSKQNKNQAEWIHKFFGGAFDFYGTSYRATNKFDESVPAAEACKLVQLMKLKPGCHILDWCGGWGRHAIPLAQQGFQVTILDFCQEYLDEARTKAKQSGVKIDIVKSDFRETPQDIQADAAINMFTAGIGYFDEADDIKALKSLRAALKPKAKIIIETMSLFWIARNFHSSSWCTSHDGSKRLLEQREFDFTNNIMHSRLIYIDATSNTEKQVEHSLRLYTSGELCKIIAQAGFKVLDVYGTLDGSSHSFESKRLIILAQK
jgi:ubiquinone/menaquinone biosynthesis C-methylase UbiE